MATKTKAQAQRTVSGWLQSDNVSHSAVIARHLASGQWVTAEWQAATFGGVDINSRALMSYVQATFASAGYHIQKQPGARGNQKEYRIRGGLQLESGAEEQHLLSPPVPEVITTPLAKQHYPALGQMVLVKALALIAGDVVIHLSDGDGGAWQAVIRGYVDQEAEQ